MCFQQSIAKRACVTYTVIRYHIFIILRYPFLVLNFRSRKYTFQNEDGGWGIHIEGESTMFGTVLNYICMRILGEERDGGKDNACERGRRWILDHGGAIGIPSWGKTWLSV